MKKYKNIAVICGLLFVVAIGFYYIGYNVACDRIENLKSQNYEQTFYATITNINDSNFEVKGLNVNGINYRGEFTFVVTTKTKMEWRGTELSVSDFDINDNISITFSGEIQEISPARILNVVRIQLLDDEK